MTFSLSGGEKNDSPEGMKLLNFTPLVAENKFLLMDRAYQGDNMRLLVKERGYEPVRQNSKYDRELYKRRNEIERFFRRIKRFRRIFTRYDKLDVLYSGFILFAMIIDCVNTP